MLNLTMAEEGHMLRLGESVFTNSQRVVNDVIPRHLPRSLVLEDLLTAAAIVSVVMNHLKRFVTVSSTIPT